MKRHKTQHDVPWPDTPTIELRVRYNECDPMNVAHHASYVSWLEIARTELLRNQGAAYRSLEEQGVFFVVARLSVRYLKPARYDDVLQVYTRIVSAGRAKIDHEYRINRGSEVLSHAQTTIVCVDRAGRLQPVPEALL